MVIVMVMVMVVMNTVMMSAFRDSFTTTREMWWEGGEAMLSE